MLSLTIHHNIHLTREQRYALHQGEEVILTGVSVPVWVVNKKTTEPAVEVFCRYVLKNPKQELPIRILDEGYEVVIPYREGTKVALTDEEWQKMHREDPEKLQQLYDAQVSEVSSKNLLDIKDGGSGSLVYREHNKIKHKDQLISIMHYVNMESMERLTDSVSIA